MGNTYYYIRTSTIDQNTERQIPDDVPDHLIFEDHGKSGRTVNREAYKELCRTVQKGDRIVFNDISRHGRSIVELISEAERLTKDGVSLEYKAQNIVLDPNKPKSDKDWIQFNLLGVLFQAQVDLQREASLQGIRKQQELDQLRPHDQKKYKGKQPTIDRTIVAELWLDKGYNKSEIARIMSISVKSVRAIIKELDLEDKQPSKSPTPDMT